MKNDPKANRRLARRIVTYLFTPGGQREKADRLALMFGERSRCGWGFGPAVDAVESILNRRTRP